MNRYNVGQINGGKKQAYSQYVASYCLELYRAYRMLQVEDSSALTAQPEVPLSRISSPLRLHRGLRILSSILREWLGSQDCSSSSSEGSSSSSSSSSSRSNSSSDSRGGSGVLAAVLVVVKGAVVVVAAVTLMVEAVIVAV
jgi:hypothetical protein